MEHPVYVTIRTVDNRRAGFTLNRALFRKNVGAPNTATAYSSQYNFVARLLSHSHTLTIPPLDSVSTVSVLKCNAPRGV